MEQIDVSALRLRIELVMPTLNEYQRRRYLSAEAKAIGRGGISLVSRLSGVSRPTLTEGVKELDNPVAEIPGQGKSRRPGGGRKPIWENSPEIFDVLSELLEAHTKGDPMRLLLRTNKSLRKLSAVLAEKGYTANKDTVGLMLKMLGYGLQADKKTLTVKPSHPDRDAQFDHINSEAQKVASKNPIRPLNRRFSPLSQHVSFANATLNCRGEASRQFKTRVWPSCLCLLSARSDVKSKRLRPSCAFAAGTKTLGL